MKCFIINTKLGVQKNTPILIFLLLSLVFIKSTKWREASTLMCELMREESEGKYRLFCRTICKPVNAAVIKGYSGRGHPAWGLPASTRTAPQRNSFTLCRPPRNAPSLVWHSQRNDADEGFFGKLSAVMPQAHSCVRNAIQFFSFLAQTLAGIGCWEVITKCFLTLSPPPPLQSSASSSLTSNCNHICLVLMFSLAFLIGG